MTSQEGGFTVIEVLVALALLLVALTMFSGALVVAERSADRQMEQGQTLNALRLALSTLDAEVRSGFVATVTDWEVTIYTELHGVRECVRWRVVPASSASAQTLQRRAWSIGDSGGGEWQVVAEGIRNGQLGVEAFTPGVDVDGVVRSLGVVFRVLTRAEKDPARIALGATEVATTLTVRNASLGTVAVAGAPLSTAC